MAINTDLSKEQIQKAEETMKYIKENVIIKNDSGKYEVNNKELNNSTFDSEEKKIISNFVEFMNASQGIQAQANAFTRCLQDAFSIGKAMANELGKDIENGNWLTAAGKLVAAGILVNPISAFAFFMACGATPVS